MAAPILRSALIRFFSDNNSRLLRKYNFSFSLYFSTESAKPPLDTPTLNNQFLINHHHFPPEAASQIASHLNPLKTQENADSIISFLKDNGFSNSQLERIAKASPHLLSANLETNIKRKFTIFQDLGFTSDEIVEIVSRQSKVLHYSAPRISSSISGLKSLLGSTAATAKFLKTYGSFLSDMEITLLPNVVLLNSCGVPMMKIIRLICSCPRFFLHKPDDMRKFVDKADEMGSDRTSGSFIHAVRVLSSMTSETWGMKVKTLLDIGFSEDDVRRAFKNTPKVFSSSREKMKRVAEVLLKTGKYDMLCIACTPIVFQFSIEGRIRPRLKVLRVLEEKGFIRDWPSLSTLVCLTDASFFERFVAPYLDDIGELWSGKSASHD